uniref:Uncharacterized protein n=1 Tax=Cacopsylla melanoneura TaxID=428564 RepID=A0A8D9BEI6_9HEMI
MVVDTRSTIRSNIFKPNNNFLPHEEYNDHYLEIKTNLTKLKSKFCQKCDLTNLTHSISELFLDINKKNNAINKLKTKHNVLNKQLETIKSENEAIKLKMVNENDRVNTIISESKSQTDQFNESLTRKDSEIIKLKHKIDSLEFRNDELIKERELRLQKNNDVKEVEQQDNTRLNREILNLKQENEALVQDKIDLIQTNNDYNEHIEELKAELVGAQFTINTLRSTFDIHCINYDDDDGNYCTTFIQISNQNSYGVSLLQEINDLTNNTSIILEYGTDNNESNIHEVSAVTCVPHPTNKSYIELDSQEVPTGFHLSPVVTVLNHTRDVSPSRELRPVSPEEIRAYDEYWRDEMEKQSKAEKTTATQQRSQPSTAYHPTQSPVTKEKTTKQCNVIPKQPNVTYSPTANQTPKVYIIGDSIAKSIVHNISVKCTPSYDVIDYTKGGMTTINTNNIPVDNPKMEDIAIIVVGTNDLFKTKWENMKEAFISLFHKLQNCKQVYVVQIIKRFDIRKINNHIAKLNTCLKHLVKSHSNVKIINTNLIKYHHLNHDKLHLNNTGKNILTHLIINEVFHRQNLQNIVTDHKTDTRQSENKHNQEKNPTETRRNKVTNNQNKSTNNSTVSKRVTSRSGDNSDRGRQVSFNPR